MTATPFVLDWHAGATAIVDLEVTENDDYRLRYTSPYRTTMRVPSQERGVRRADFDEVPRSVDAVVRDGGFLARGSAANGGPKRSPDTIERLADAGRMLLELALPRYAVNELRDSGSLFIELATDQTLNDLPWELMHDGEEFLALKHHLGRFLIQHQPQSGALAPHELRRELGALRALVVCVANPGRGLPALSGAERECHEVVTALVDAGVSVDTQTGKNATKANVLRALREPHHIIHFTGHAIAARDDPRQSALVLHDANLTVSTLNATLGHQQALFCFVNGCETTSPGVPAPSAAGSVWDAQFALFGLARAFLESGAYVLGTRWRLPDDSGLGFAKTFYEMLLAGGAPIGRAISEARRALRDKDPDDITWASYVYWGDPRVSFRPAAPAMPPPTMPSRPSVAPPSASDASAPRIHLDQLDRLAEQYAQARASLPEGTERTIAMTRIMSEATALSYGLDGTAAVKTLLGRGDDASRVLALAILEGVPDRARLDFLLDAVENSRTAFEQYHALLALKLLGTDVPAAARDHVAAVLQAQFTREGFLGTDRFVLAQDILARLGVDEQRDQSG